VQAEVLDQLLKQAVGLAEPKKSWYVVEVWRHFKAINSLLRSAQLGEDIAQAKKLDAKPHLPEISVLSKYLNDSNLHL
jgi:hypothetical protein